MKTLKTLDQILTYDGDEFVSEVYRVLLGRDPDLAGKKHYLDLLCYGLSKQDIVIDIARSPECQRAGLEKEVAKFIKTQRWKRNFIAKWWNKRNSRISGLSRKIATLETRIAELSKELDSSSLQLKMISDFDAKQYLMMNEDVAEAGVNPYEHYIEFGFKEGRRTFLSGSVQKAASCDWLNALQKSDFEYHECIDIVVPVYNGFEYLEPLFESIIKNTNLKYRVIIVDDCSPDQRIFPILKKYESKFANALLVKNQSNLGFIGSVNRAVTEVSSEFFVILNTDTEVPYDWLARLLNPMLMEMDVASVTPFSNAATICSFPIFLQDNPIYLGLSLDFIDAEFSKIPLVYPLITLPTGIGFCMGIRKSVVDEIGMFDTIFGKGYGEENDWCMRAAYKGYKHVFATNLYVYHKHGGSFPTHEKLALVEKNLKLLGDKHPSYHGLVQEHISGNPAEAVRQLVKLMLLAKSSIGVVLIIDHDLGGGANTYRNSVVGKFAEQKKISIILVDDTLRQGAYFISCEYSGEKIKLSFSEVGALSKAIDCLPITEIIYNNLVGSAYPLDILGVIKDCAAKRDLPILLLMHDFFPVCPSYTLLNHNGVYCGVPEDLAVCDKCVNNLPEYVCGFLPIAPDVQEWRNEWVDFASRCNEIRCFSESTYNIFIKTYPQVTDLVTVVPHLVTYRPSKIPLIQSKIRLHIGVIGGINFAKGRGVLESLVEFSARHDFPCDITVIGELDRPVRGIVTTGRYNIDDLPSIIERNNINIILFPSIWPETFSYVTSEVISLDMPLACFDLGAPAERVRIYPKGLVLDSFEPDMILQGLHSLCERCYK